MKNGNLELYKLLKDSYEGMGGYLDGSYLVKHTRESDQKYAMRRKLAYYLNYFKPCVDAHVSPIFKKMAVRDWKGPGSSLWEKFVNNVDCKGTKLKDMMKQAAKKSKINGTCFIVMDRAENVSEMTLESLEQNRQNLPYAFVVEPVRVLEVKSDKFGRIIKFVYVEPDAFDEDKMAERTLLPEGWELKDSKGEHKGAWNLGVVPVIPVPSKVDDDPFNPLPASEFISIAMTNKVIYNKCSWLTDILVNQTFSILVYPSTSEDALEIGTSNALGFPPEASHEPKFIAPSPDPANQLENSVNSLQNECYRMAGVVNITGVRSEQSGVAKAWDFENTNQALSDFADILENVELSVADMFKRFVNVEFKYTVNYPNDFSIADVQTELANAEIAKGLGFGDKFNLQIFKRVLTSYLPELPDKEFDNLVKDYELKLEKEALDYSQDDQDNLPDDDGEDDKEQ